MPSKNAAYVSYAGKEHFVPNYEVINAVLLSCIRKYSHKLQILRDYLVTDFRGFHRAMVMFLQEL